MSLKRTLLAVVVFIALIAMYIGDGWRRDAADAAQREAVHPFGSDAEAITAITLERMGGTVELEKAEGGWLIRQPLEAKADPQVIRTLLDQLVAQESGGFEEGSGKELEAYGLAQPAYAIQAKTGAGIRDLVFGQEAPLAGRIYARMRDGSKVFTISRDLAEIAIRPVNELRDRRVLPFDVTLADTFSITYEGRTLEAARSGEKWNIIRPQPIEADPRTVGEFLQAIQIARIEDFMDTGTQELAALGLEAPAVAAFFSSGAEKHSLLIGHRRLNSERPVYYAKQAEAPGVFAVPQALFMLLQARASDLRNKMIFTLAREDVATFELEFGGRVTRLRRAQDGSWLMDEPEGRKADQATVDQLLTRLLRIEVIDYLDFQPTPDISGMNEPYVRVKIANADGSRAEGLETGRPHVQSDHVYARGIGASATQSEIFLIGKDEPGNFFLLPEAFADKTILSFVPGDVKMFTVAAQNQVLTFQREDNAWVASLAGGQDFYQIKSALAERFLSAALGLKWKKLLDPADEADQAMIAKSGLEKPNGIFTFYDASGQELGRFAQGTFDQTTVFIRRGENDIFATDRNTYAAFVGALGALVQRK